jgi:hypothetical protein
VISGFVRGCGRVSYGAEKLPELGAIGRSEHTTSTGWSVPSTSSGVEERASGRGTNRAAETLFEHNTERAI